MSMSESRDRTSDVVGITSKSQPSARALRLSFSGRAAVRMVICSYSRVFISSGVFYRVYLIRLCHERF